MLISAASGIAVAWAFQAGLGDGTWSISTGIGACMAAAVYEVGRPDRLNPEEAVELESQWQEFGKLNPVLLGTICIKAFFFTCKYIQDWFSIMLPALVCIHRCWARNRLSRASFNGWIGIVVP